MAKALMVGATNAALTLASGVEINLLGTGGTSTTEANSQYSATEAATFSNLRSRIIVGGSGTNNLRFRKGGADGNQLASRTGTGDAEDTTNTDVLAAADLFNLAATDDGTDPQYAWTAGNVAFSSGYGAFHGAATFSGLVFDAQNSTRFIGLSGGLAADGNTTEAQVAFLAHGYTTFEALQVRVTANARTNDSVFHNRISLANGSATITFATTVTGLLTATGLADAIADGDGINASIVLVSGVQDLTVSFVGATLKSSDSEQDCWSAIQGGVARTASATAHYVAPGGNIINFTGLTEAQARIKPGFAGTAKNLRCYVGANTYTGAATLKLMQNGVAVLTQTISVGDANIWIDVGSASVQFDDNDEFSFEIDEGTSGSATFYMIGVTLAPPSAGVSLVKKSAGRGLYRGVERGMRTAA